MANIDGYWNRTLAQRLSRRRALAVAGATAAGSAMLIACGGNEGAGTLKLDDAGSSRNPGTVWFAKNDWTLADETKEAKPGGIYRGVMDSEQEGHYDAMVQPPSAVPFSKHVHEFLLTKNRGPGIDPTSAAAGAPAPALAQSWEISKDGMSITFKLRPGVKWHPVAPVNGRVMDIDDWKSSMDRHLATGPHRATILEVFDKATYPDANTMVWSMKYPYGAIFERVWSERFSHVIMPKELNADPNLAAKTSIGTGYKILDKHQPSLTMEYRKHADYWGGKPFIDRWHAPVIPEYANRYAQFVNGNIMEFTPTAKDVLALAKDAPKAVIVANPIPDDNNARMRFGLISPENWPWADARVRIAIRRSIDFKSIATFLSNKQQFEAAGIPIELRPMTHVPQHPGYALNPEEGELGAVSANLLYDMAEAKKLTAAAGHSQPIEMTYYVLAERNEVAQADQLVMDSLSAAGTFKLNVFRSATATQHRQYRSLLEMDGFVAQSSTSEDADYFVYRDYHSRGRDGSEGRERQAYPDPRTDRLAEAQRRELDPQKRFQFLKDFQILAAELMPAVPGRHLTTTFVFRWPWLHNAHQGSAAAPPEGRPIGGGHLQWLDADMPSRDRVT